MYRKFTTLFGALLLAALTFSASVAPLASAGLQTVEITAQKTQRGDFTQGFRDGFRKGHDDGEKDGRLKCTKRSSGHSPFGETDYEREFEEGYPQGYKSGFERICVIL